MVIRRMSSNSILCTPANPETDSQASVESASTQWKVNSEIAVLLGWGTAILMEVAHPLVAAGVYEHSSFTANPNTRLSRLHQTLSAMLALTFGTPEEAERAAQGIQKIHDYVNGELKEAAGAFPAGARYSAHDPELLRWVHATILYSFPRAYELYVGPLTLDEKDRYCSEAAQVGGMLGIPEGYLPRNTSELQVYLDGMLASNQIAVTRTAHEIGRELLNPLYPSILWWLYWPVKLVTIAGLPPEIRQMYGYPWSSTHRHAHRLLAALLRRILPALPSLLRHWPSARRARDRVRHRFS